MHVQKLYVMYSTQQFNQRNVSVTRDKHLEYPVAVPSAGASMVVNAQSVASAASSAVSAPVNMVVTDCKDKRKTEIIKRKEKTVVKTNIKSTGLENDSSDDDGPPPLETDSDEADDSPPPIEPKRKTKHDKSVGSVTQDERLKYLMRSGFFQSCFSPQSSSFK